MISLKRYYTSIKYNKKLYQNQSNIHKYFIHIYIII